MAQKPIFELLNSINYSKQDLLGEGICEEKEYQPFVINRFLSAQMDTVIYANEMNTRPFLTKKMQYDFLRNIIRSRKRYSKWLKKNDEDTEHIENVKNFYQCSTKIARKYIQLLNEEQLDMIAQKTNKGGKTK